MLRIILEKIIFGGGVIFDLAKWFILGVVFLIIINSLFIAVFVVDGQSMEENLHNKELVLWNKNAYNKDNPARGDIVVASYPGDIERKYVKRIIGLPGERVDVYKCKIYINKVLLKEKYIPHDMCTDKDGTWNLNDKQFFIVGDNRLNSNDSRYFGAVERRFIHGKAISVMYPRIRLVKYL